MKRIRTCVITEIFEITHGNKFDLNKMSLTSGGKGVNFIGRSAEKNGISAEVMAVPGVPPYEAGAITVALGGSALSSFVQPKRFYTAQNIDVLVPKIEMELDEKLYYCACIEANRFRYSTFGREANRTLKNLRVPCVEDIPTWVMGSTKTAVREMNEDLLKAIGAD